MSVRLGAARHWRGQRGPSVLRRPAHGRGPATEMRARPERAVRPSAASARLVPLEQLKSLRAAAAVTLATGLRALFMWAVARSAIRLRCVCAAGKFNLAVAAVASGGQVQAHCTACKRLRCRVQMQLRSCSAGPGCGCSVAGCPSVGGQLTARCSRSRPRLAPRLNRAVWQRGRRLPAAQGGHVHRSSRCGWRCCLQARPCWSCLRICMWSAMQGRVAAPSGRVASKIRAPL